MGSGKRRNYWPPMNADKAEENRNAYRRLSAFIGG
jgi:hypothetical protein